MLELIEKVSHDGAAGDSLTLPFELRQKSRQRVCLDSGREAALVLAPGTQLDEGDLLRATDGTLVRVGAATEAVSTARAEDPLHLARACYHLGNRHVALQIGHGWLRYVHDHVLDDMLRGMGLAVLVERAPFEPEGGAYVANTHSHTHSHQHD
jgi:urease accessory protein